MSASQINTVAHSATVLIMRTRLKKIQNLSPYVPAYRDPRHIPLGISKNVKVHVALHGNIHISMVHATQPTE